MDNEDTKSQPLNRPDNSKEELMETNLNLSKAQSQTQRKKISIQEYITNTKATAKINSPRSIVAAKDLGISWDQLKYINFSDFKTSHPEIIPLPMDIQIKRYNFYETKRNKAIKEIFDKRATITYNLETEGSNFYSISKEFPYNNRSKEYNPSKTGFNFKSTAIQNEMKDLEKMKQKNKKDLITMVQFEVQSDLIHKEALEEVRRQKEKRQNYENQWKQKRDQEEREKQEKEKWKRWKEEEWERQKDAEYKEKQRLELLKIQELKEQEEEKKRLMMRNKQEEEEKRLKYQAQMNEKYEKFRLEMEEYKKVLDEKDRQREIKNEEKRLKKIEESEWKKEMKQKIIDRNNEKTQKQFMEIRKAYWAKQRQIEMKKYEIECRQKHEQELLNQKKINTDKKIQEILNRNNELLHEKRFNALERIYQHSENTRLVKERQQMTTLTKMEIHCEKQIEQRDNIRRIENKNEFKKEVLMGKLREKEMRLAEFKRQKEELQKQKQWEQEKDSRRKKEFIDKFEMLSSKKGSRNVILKEWKKTFGQCPEIDDLVNNINNPNWQELKKKQKKAATFTLVSGSIDKKKSKSMNKTREYNSEKSYNSSKMNTNNIETIRNNDEGKEEKIYLTQPDKTSLNASKNSNELPKELNTDNKNSSTITNSKPNGIYYITEKWTSAEIEEKVREYQSKLNQEIKEFIGELRDREALQDEILKKIKTKKEIKKLEKEFGKERLAACEYWERKTEENKVKVNDYEEQLRIINKSL